MDENLIDRIATMPLLPAPAERARLRQALGLRQLDLARELGVSTQTIYAWEHGQAVPRGARHQAYAELLHAMQVRIEGGGSP